MHRRGASLAGMVVASLLLFAVGITVAANAIGNLIGSLDVTALGLQRYDWRTIAAATYSIPQLYGGDYEPDENEQPRSPPSLLIGYNVNATLLVCPITGYPCEGDLSYLCEDYGCARKGGLSPRSDEN